MTDRVRFILEWIPRDKVEKLAKLYAAEIANGASIWDFQAPEYMTVERELLTEAEAFTHAKSILPNDEFGEIHAFEQHLLLLEGARRKTWETTRRAVVYEEDSAFGWASVSHDD